MGNLPVIDTIATGLNIKRLRINAGLSVRDLQAVFGFNSPQTIYRWQDGTAMPSLDNLVILAAAFAVTIDEIIILRDDQNLSMPGDRR